MKVLYVGFKGSNKLFLTNSYDGIKSNLDDGYEIIK